MNLSGRGSTDAAVSFINALSEGVKQRRIYQFNIAQQNLRRKQAREDVATKMLHEMSIKTSENLVQAGEDPFMGSGGFGGGGGVPGVAAPGAVIPGLENLVGGIGSQQPTTQPDTPPTVQEQLIQGYRDLVQSQRKKFVAGENKVMEERLRKQLSEIVGPILKEHPEIATLFYEAGSYKYFLENPREIGPLLRNLSNFVAEKELKEAADLAEIDLDREIAAERRQITGGKKAGGHKVLMGMIEEYPELIRHMDDNGNITDREALMEDYKVLEGQIETVPLSFFGTPGSPSEGHYQEEIQTKAMDRINNEWARITLRIKEWDDPDYNKFVQKLFEDVSKLIVNSVRSAVGDAIQKANVEGTITKAQRTVLLREQKNPDNVHIKNIIRLLKKAYGRMLAKNESVAKQGLFRKVWDRLF